MPDEVPFHVFYVQPMPGVMGSGRIVVSQEDTQLFILLPDGSNIIITADRAVFVKSGYMMNLVQWQMAPSEFMVPEELPMTTHELQNTQPMEQHH